MLFRFFVVVASLLILAPASGRAADSLAAQISGEIETIGFYNAARFGYGGMVVFAPTPVVLFRSGDALKSITALNAPEGLSAHRTAHPKEWTLWRRNGRQIEWMRDKGWEALPYAKVMAPLPRGTVLTGVFRNLAGAGTQANGGASAVAGWKTFSFADNGNFSVSGGAGTSSAFGDASAITHSAQAAQGGKYAIDGYRLSLSYGDGRTENHLIVTDPSNPKNAVWIDGAGYSRR